MIWQSKSSGTIYLSEKLTILKARKEIIVQFFTKGSNFQYFQLIFTSELFSIHKPDRSHIHAKVKYPIQQYRKWKNIHIESKNKKNYDRIAFYEIKRKIVERERESTRTQLSVKWTASKEGDGDGDEEGEGEAS